MTVSSRNPAKDQVAIASAATTGFTAANTDRSQLSYATQACIAALRAAGLGAADVDGIIGSANPSATELQQALGIPAITYFANPPIPLGNQLAAAVAAVHSGLCNVALVYHASYRLPWNTGSALKDPFRRGGMAGEQPPVSPNRSSARSAIRRGRHGISTSSAAVAKTSVWSRSTAVATRRATRVQQ